MTPIKLNPNFKSRWIIGHRGFSARFPENTLISFQAAIEAGVTMIELDVMLSRDRKLAVIHDPTLARTTNGKGAVADYTLAELKQLDAGSWFDPKFAGQRIPGLSEVLECVNRRAYVNIEIKSNAYESDHPPDAIERQVVELLRQKNLTAISIISSFNVNILEQIASMQNAPTIALISKKPLTPKTIHLCSRLNVFSWHPDRRILTRNQVNLMHAAGIRVFPYKVDTLEDYTKMRDMKVDGVITDDPVSAALSSNIKKAA
jgi:glycerophosphoryl diester phosphodiesterase